ncbi:PREDICTED: uncharacterized protein LOC105967546 [Erythranthe guttata]|uniref:uncharacterized protein LOC105967546 n=1 Tax=Erythranthe guttata TaxID=4155 RepID=UPI00064DD21C|nr:PREDICTED: uncharacterized protein LOC105967546 [Erythranthe guttata]|eukprot:XP_012847600.1 PREDICTED: uncharacterized protein LOC105967546 [Erythranthe guttata]
MGIDPTTHKPMSHALISQPKDLSHMAQWETARLEAESRIVRESKLALSNPNPNPNYYNYHYHYYNKTATAAAAPPPPPPPPPPRPPCLDILKVWQGMTWTNPRKDHTMVNNNNNNNRGFTADHGMLMANYTPAPPLSDGLTIHESAFLNDGRETSHEDDQQIKEVIFFEDNKVTDYWSNILNVVNSSIDLHHCF